MRIPHMTAFARPTYVLIHLFSGRRRQGDLQHYVELAMVKLDVQIKVVSLDVQVDARLGDLADPKIVAFWELEIRRGRVVAMMGGPPCSTWSVARFNRRRPGPRPVRSMEQPWGLDGLTPAEQASVELGNLLLRAALRFARMLALSGEGGGASS